jgi:hypothetical protein
MKKSVELLLVAIMATGSMTAASDTLRVTSFRTVDLCSDERRWLISVSMGQMYHSDSLQSFDITIGYDTSIIRPTDGLTSGTLSEQMKFADISPAFNFRVPGEIRVGAFTINTNVIGDKPLFAVAGDFLGDCTSNDTFSFPWPASFNEEFKGVVRYFTTDTVLPVTNARQDHSSGVWLDLDSVLINGKDSTASIPVRVQRGMIPTSPLRVSLITVPPRAVEISRIEGRGIDSTSVSVDGSTADVWLNGTVLDTVTLTVEVVSRTSAEDTTVMIHGRVYSDQDCSCWIPAQVDSMIVRSRTATTSHIAVEVHESAGIQFEQDGSNIRIQSSHGQPWIVTVSDLIGNRVAELIALPGNEHRLSLHHLSPGLYMIGATNGLQRVQKKFLK